MRQRGGQQRSGQRRDAESLVKHDISRAELRLVGDDAFRRWKVRRVAHVNVPARCEPRQAPQRCCGAMTNDSRFTDPKRSAAHLLHPGARCSLIR